MGFVSFGFLLFTVATGTAVGEKEVHGLGKHGEEESGRDDASRGSTTSAAAGHACGLDAPGPATAAGTDHEDVEEGAAADPRLLERLGAVAQCGVVQTPPLEDQQVAVGVVELVAHDATRYR